MRHCDRRLRIMTKKKTVLKVLEHMEQYDPEGAALAHENIWEEFAAAAGVPVVELRRAIARITWEGYYGPVSDEDFILADDSAMTLHRAKTLVRAALEAYPTVKYEHPDVGYLCSGASAPEPDDAHIELCTHPDHKELEDGGPLFHCEPITIDTNMIRRCVFHSLIEIYGSLNI